MASKINNRLIIFLIIISIFVIFLGYIQLRGAIYAPFNQIIVKEPEEVLDQAEIKAILSEQDTDKDGLSDFDENYVYQTSVYLVDSDGDTFSDKEEVDAQSNPLDQNSTRSEEHTSELQSH